MAANLSSVSTPEELYKFRELVKSLKTLHKDIGDITSELSKSYTQNNNTNSILKLKCDYFRNYLEEFITHYINVSYRAHLQFSVPKDNDSTLDKTLKRQKISPNQNYFPNTLNIKTGTMITSQMEYFCRVLFLRSIANLDSIILVSAERGSGKSCFALTVASVLSSMHQVPFVLNRQVMFQQKREEVKTILKTLPPHTSFILDQASAQLSSRQGMKGGQIDLLNEIDFSRVKGRTLIINWHSTDELDKQVRTMATAVVTIPKRSIAIFKSVDNNTNNRGSTTAGQRTKNSAIMDEDQHIEAEKSEPTTLFKIPYRDLESSKLNTPFANKLWADYSDYKELAGKEEEYMKERKFLDPALISNLDSQVII